jgi:hypothetical protein
MYMNGEAFGGLESLKPSVPGYDTHGFPYSKELPPPYLKYRYCVIITQYLYRRYSFNRKELYRSMPGTCFFDKLY